jgi:Tfp pilus assembly protein PilV
MIFAAQDRRVTTTMESEARAKATLLTAHVLTRIRASPVPPHTTTIGHAERDEKMTKTTT